MSQSTILVADDDRQLTHLLDLALRPLGARITTVNDAMSALNALHDRPRDLAILDINMPTGSGLGVCEMLASDAKLASMPVIVFTGRSDDVTRRRCQNVGAMYVQKGPGAIDQVREMVVRLLSPHTLSSSPAVLYFG